MTKRKEKSKPESFYIVNTKEAAYSFVVPNIGVVKIKPGYNEFSSREERDQVLRELAKTFEDVKVSLEE